IKIKVPAFRSYLDINILFFSISLHCKLKKSLFPEQANFDAFLCCFFLLSIIGPVPFFELTTANQLLLLTKSFSQALHIVQGGLWTLLIPDADIIHFKICN